MARRLLSGLALWSTLTALAACDMATAPLAPPPAVPRPDRPAPVVPSAESQALTERYARVEADLLTRGLLRTDGGGADAPFDADILARNFNRIALYDEFVPVSGRLVARETSSHLRRWDAPVRIGLIFGASVPAWVQARDRATVDALADRLRTASGHDIRTTPDDGNLTVFVVNEDERRALAPHLKDLVPGITSDVLRAVTDMPPTTFCLIIAFSADAEPHVYRRAIGIIRAEHPPLLRKSCFHEEITQGLGLANDSPDVRPSIFNDDEEFALLTDQDLLMLTILYDRRLIPGMTAAQAAPIVRVIAYELRPDPEPISRISAEDHERTAFAADLVQEPAYVQPASDR
ncbi:MAG: DUF2927 domain-containing protein [Rhodobacteraceae bacterium]|nr:DUF2927 domain-containing protein [Paracoccaceae bacterium]